MKVRYTEAFYSVQGEGRFMGVPSVFLRMFGCNFTCPKFGIARASDATAEPEISAIINDIGKYNSIKELPLVTVGCDSYAAWHPSFKHLQTDTDVEGLVDALLELTPTGSWTLENGQDIHLVITGGEPLLGWQRAYAELLDHPRMKDLQNVTFETNTTQALSGDFESYLNDNERLHTTFSCSPKLSVSGHVSSDAIKPDIAYQYSNINNSHLYFKFVVADSVDVVEVDEAVEVYRKAGVNAPVYIMPVGGTSDSYFNNGKVVADLALQKGYRYSARLHVDIFGNSWGT